MEVFDTRVCRLGEGPWYDEVTDRVGWVDILNRRVLWRGLETGEIGELTAPGHVGAAVPTTGHDLVLCLPEGPSLLDRDGGVRPLGTYAAADAAAGRAPGPAALRSNDAKADPRGRLWLGTMAYDNIPGAGALYRLDHNGLTRVLDDVTISNGLGWSPDGSTMYYIDTPTGRVDAFAFDLDRGELGERRVFAEVDEGFPDGLCVDADGGVWVALWEGGAVRRYRPDGSLDRSVPVGAARVTSCTFAGPGLETLIVTTATSDETAADPGGGLTYAHRPGDVVGRHVDRIEA